MRTQKHDGSMRAGMGQLSGLRDELGMTDACHEYATSLFREAVVSGFLVGRVVSHCAAASALLACRKHDANCTIGDVMRATGLAKHDIYRTYRQLYEKFDPDLPVPDPAPLIAKICRKLGVGEEVRRDAEEMLTSMDRTEMAGKGPGGLAAGALYVACVRLGEMVLRRDIAGAAGVAETTLSNRYNELVAAATV